MNGHEVGFPLVNVERVIELHAAAIASKGGAPGLRDPGLLHGAIEGALTAAMYASDDGQPDPLQIADHLLYYISRAHPFVDGNKRAAWLACEDQLRCLGIKVIAATDDAENMVLAVTTGRCSVAVLVEWMSVWLDDYEPSTTEA